MLVKELSIIKPWTKQDLGGKRPDKSVCVVRYGGFGDLIQASSLFPWFKENGWRVTANVDPKGYDIIKHDPHIDEAFIQRQGQVPNEELGPYWDKLAGCFDRFVQLSESIEKSLLSIPGEPEYDMTTRDRHRLLNVDYFKRIHDIAGVPLPPRPAFYPSRAEKKWAKKIRNKLGGYVVLWVLSGSSPHKAYPYTDQVVAEMLLSRYDIRVVFVGEELCQLLEDPWRNEPRVIKKSGVWNIRETLAFADCADVIVGPETGVLNAFAFKDNYKIMMLSHSSPVNIGGSWKNTEVLTPHGCDCYPCHKMHYGWSSCNRDAVTGGAVCAAGISPERVYSAIIQKRAA